MKMYFHFDLDEMILLKQWIIKEPWQMILACVVVSLGAFLIEALNHVIGITCRCQLNKTFRKLALSKSPSHCNSSAVDREPIVVNHVHQHLHNNINETQQDNLNSQEKCLPSSYQSMAARGQTSNLETRQLIKYCCQEDKTTNQTFPFLAKLHCNYENSSRTIIIARLLKCFGYGIQTILSLTLMLVAMTYNVYLILSIALGKFCFNNLRCSRERTIPIN